MPVAREITCPCCGAPLHAIKDTATCEFCGTAVVVEPDPPPPPAARSSDAADATHLPCPRCGVALFEGRAGDFVLDGCGTCGGIWVDNEGSQEVVRHANARLVELAERAERHATAKVDARPTAACPACRATMKRVRVARANVDLDVCEPHGTWFDAHELQTVARAFSFTGPTFLASATFVSPAEIPDFRAGQRGEDVATVAVGILGVLGTILSVAGGSSNGS